MKTYVALMNIKHFYIENNIDKLAINKLGQFDNLKLNTFRALL
jgi:hypothetical protein